MTQQEKHMEWDEWASVYQPVMCNVTQDDGEPIEFEDCKDAVEFVKEQMPDVPENDRYRYVWTTTAGDDWSYTSTGCHVVDRMHCYVCRVPWTELSEACMYEEREDD